MRFQLKADPPGGDVSGAERAITPTVSRPGLSYERDLLLRGARRIAGVDEAGRGALAGPVAAAAVILPDHPVDWFDDVDDSKRLAETERERLSRLILRDAAVGLAMMPASVIDSDGIAAATRQTMRAALAALGGGVDGILVDGFGLPEQESVKQIALVRGDQVSLSIAAASIVAKVARDAVMRELDTRYPGYALARNKGYGTAAHRAALRSIGPSPLHRRSFHTVGEDVRAP